jgi:hypothetical protein
MLALKQDPPTIRPEGFISLNKIFRWLLLLLGFFFSVAFWNQSQNGRYVLHNTADHVLMIDTRTGEVSWPNIPSPFKPLSPH